MNHTHHQFWRCCTELSSLDKIPSYPQAEALSLIHSYELREDYLLAVMNQSPELDLQLMEAIKALMMLRAITLYDLHKSQPRGGASVFAWLMFSRKSSETPELLFQNHVNTIGDTTMAGPVSKVWVWNPGCMALFVIALQECHCLVVKHGYMSLTPHCSVDSFWWFSVLPVLQSHSKWHACHFSISNTQVFIRMLKSTISIPWKDV